MGRITINGTQAGFSCKKEVSLALWDVKTNRAKGKSEEARTLNQELDNIKAQIISHFKVLTRPKTVEFAKAHVPSIQL